MTKLLIIFIACFFPALLFAGTGSINVNTANVLSVQGKDATGLRLYEQGGAGLYIQNGGNVGIGTLSPTNKFEVSGNVLITGNVTANTIDTGLGANELYGMNQGVKTTDGVTFATISSPGNVTGSTLDTGNGAGEFYPMDQSVKTTDMVTFVTVNATDFVGTVTTASYALDSDKADGYHFDQAVQTASDVTHNIINTTTTIKLGGIDINTAGILSNVAYLDQINVFSVGQTIQGNVTGNTVDTGQGSTEVYLQNQNIRTTDEVTFATINATYIAGTITTASYAVNADTVDGYHHDQSLLIAASPTFANIETGGTVTANKLTDGSASISGGVITSPTVNGTVLTDGTATITAGAITGATNTNWDTAYSDRLKWDGADTDLVASTARTSLGLSAVDNVTFATVNATDVLATTLTGTLQTAAQGNITSLGTLTALNVGNLNIDTNTISSVTGTITLDPLSGYAVHLPNEAVDATDYTLLLGASIGAATAGARVKLAMGNPDGRCEFTMGQSATNYLQMSWLYNATANNAEARLFCQSGNNNLLLQDNGGKVGIGIGAAGAGPTQTLDVSGNIKANDIYLNNLAYGGIGVSYNAVATDLTQDVYATVTTNTFQSQEILNVTVTADTGILTVLKAGHYKVDLYMTFARQQAADDIHGGICFNDASPLGHHEFSSAFNATDEVSVSCGAIKELSAGDTVCVKIKNTTGSRTVTVTHMFLSALRIAP